MMDDFVKQQLSKIIAQEGTIIVQDPRRVKAYLADLCPTAKRQVRALLTVLDEGYVNKILQDNTSTPSGVLLHRFSSLLHDEIGLDLNLAKWAVQTWIEALFPKVMVTIPMQAVIVQSLPAITLNASKNQIAATDVIIEDDDSWMQRLWDWADKYEITDLVWHANGGYWRGLPRDKNKLKKLDKLRLDHFKLNDIPSEIGFLVNLVEIDFSNNNLTTLPSELSLLVKINSLSLYRNKFKKIPASLFKLKSLKKIYFGGNNISNIDVISLKKYIYKCIIYA
jgi:hypothetical protein